MDVSLFISHGRSSSDSVLSQQFRYNLSPCASVAIAVSIAGTGRAECDYQTDAGIGARAALAGRPHLERFRVLCSFYATRTLGIGSAEVREELSTVVRAASDTREWIRCALSSEH